MVIQTSVNVKINKTELATAISNALFTEFTKNKRKVMDMTCYEMCEHIPDVITEEIVESFERGELVLFEP